ncbi:MAG: transcription elongation factor GreA [Mycobacteriales bacterium]|nr:transcription elongation factor GreA [Frankia sp.]
MTETSPTTTWLTPEAYQRLQHELEELSGPGREQVVNRIAAAREEGDLRENGGYHAAKEEQGKLEARIRQLTVLLREAKVGEAPVSVATAAPGMLVTVRYEDDTETETFLLGSREDHVAEHEVYSPSSPLGRAVLGHAPGDVVSYDAPRRSMKVTIVSLEPYTA